MNLLENEKKANFIVLEEGLDEMFGRSASKGFGKEPFQRSLELGLLIHSREEEEENVKFLFYLKLKIAKGPTP